eukprot:8875893-Lingulodinium_polyedra.AAC.1
MVGATGTPPGTRSAGGCSCAAPTDCAGSSWDKLETEESSMWFFGIAAIATLVTAQGRYTTLAIGERRF